SGTLPTDRRLGMALVVSALLHALLMLSLSKFSLDGSVFMRPLDVPLRVRIEQISESRQASPLVINKRKSVVHREPAASEPVAPSVPAEAETSLPQPGVSVAETLYLRPLPSRADSALLATGEFHRSSEVSEKPEAIRMRMPNYPRPAQEQHLSGSVLVMFLVDENGKVLETTALDSSESFGEFRQDIASEMVSSSFIPGKVDGLPVKTLAFVMVRFDAKGLSGFDVASPSRIPLADHADEKH
ncbi:MAG: energy transducer TonB, partial [Burkholderiales bacterium]